jgi:AraC-like DNA-binding protein
LNLDITKRWTVELLARAVGLSRPVFAKKFVRTLGRSPMRYLTQQRMQLAAALLLDPDATLAEVANRVGYQSEFAFSRAFKRHHDVPPGEYRRRGHATQRVTLALAA